MNTTGIISIAIIAINVIVSYKGFNDQFFLDNYSFRVDKVLINKDYKRLITSGFLHVSWLHLIFNMISLYLFSSNLEQAIGGLDYAIIYFASLVGGNLFALLVHKDEGNYSSVGASGAVCGIIFSSIALFPGFSIGFFGIPFFIPAWLYGAAFVLYSIYGIRSGKDNIGHEAHLGGSLVGMVIALIMYPEVIKYNYLPVILIVVPAVIFIYFIIKQPGFLWIQNNFFRRKSYTTDDRYNVSKRNLQEEIDEILDKINKSGVKSLTEKEKRKLKAYSESR